MANNPRTFLDLSIGEDPLGRCASLPFVTVLRHPAQVPALQSCVRVVQRSGTEDG